MRHETELNLTALTEAEQRQLFALLAKAATNTHKERGQEFSAKETLEFAGEFGAEYTEAYLTLLR